MIIVKSIVLLIYTLSLFNVVRLGSILFNKERYLTGKGHKEFGIYLTGLVLSALQLFNVFDFIGYIVK